VIVGESDGGGVVDESVGGGVAAVPAASDAGGADRGSTCGATGSSGSLAVGSGMSDGGGMDAPDLGRRSATDDTSESHSPQNAVSAWTGAPHAGQMS
jgi:hypothetical protein